MLHMCLRHAELSIRYQQLVGVRVALGTAEAGLFPGVAW